VADERAVLFTPRGGPRVLLVGDLHIGIETDFAIGGVQIPSATPAMVERIKRLAQVTRARKLVIVGDLKHSLGVPTQQEEVEVPWAMAEVAKAFEEVVVVPGNHDGLIGRFLPGGADSRGGLLVVHGHAWPDAALAGRARALAAAHTHAAVALQDPMGKVQKEACWARARVNPEAWRDRFGADNWPELVLMPPFNDLCTGVPLNVAGGLGPLLRGGLVDLGAAQVYLLDGIHLGTIRSLELALDPVHRRRLTRGVHEDL
jgi:putative SbcD/Mre11-related phosphoesterase